MDTKKIEWLEEKQKLIQAMSGGIEIAFASRTNKQVSPFAFCKDYLQDAIQGFLNKEKRQIYGFTYDPKVHEPIYLRKTKLLVTNSSDNEFGSKIPNCLNFLNRVENHLFISPTKISICEEPPLQYIRPGVYLFEGSGRWLNSPPMISLYTLFIRLGFGYTSDVTFQKFLEELVAEKREAYQKIDRRRLMEAIKGINRILDRGDRNIFHNDIRLNYPAEIKTTTMHNTLGICGFSNNKTKKLFPSWHRGTK